MQIRLKLKQLIDNHLFGKPGEAVYGCDNERLIMFAPHQDDETLGAGGTIIKKTQQGSHAWVIYMTDGSRTNNNHIHLYLPTERLIGMRRDEAQQACAILGVPQNQIHFLGFEDSQLCNHQSAALTQVKEIVSGIQPTAIFIPYLADRHPDHEATAKIAIHAMTALKLETDIYEYPAWFWHCWPLVKRDISGKEFMAEMLTLFRGVRALNCSQDIHDVLNIKHKAIQQHRSQMQNITGKEGWGTLQGIGAGEWFDYFFRQSELFRLSKLSR